MGNTSSTRQTHDDSVDYGQLTPQGVYSGPQDWNHSIVSQFIINRKLAPFYKPLEDYDPSWDSERILAARKDPAQSSNAEISNNNSHNSHPDPAASPRPSSNKHPKSSSPKESTRIDEAALYKDAVECPICFLVRLLPSFQPNCGHISVCL
jgi:hypothetical protein